MGMSAALLVGDAHAASLTAAAVLSGRSLESRARARAAAALSGAAQVLEPATATRLLEHGEGEGAAGTEEVPLRDVRVGDRVRVLPHARVPVDGRCASAAVELDESLMTGESAPQRRAEGDVVLSGSVVVSEAPVTLKVTAVGRATRLARLGAAVRRARATKSPTQRMADQAASVFTPVVAAGAAGTALWCAGILGDPSGGALAAASVLVAACPCALGLAAPVALQAALGRASANGLVVRDAAALERLGRSPSSVSPTTYVLDKTGTLTTGRLRVTRSRWLSSEAEGAQEAIMAAVVAAEEHAGDHPIARALLQEQGGR